MVKNGNNNDDKQHKCTMFLVGFARVLTWAELAANARLFPVLKTPKILFLKAKIIQESLYQIHCQNYQHQ